MFFEIVTPSDVEGLRDFYYTYPALFEKLAEMTADSPDPCDGQETFVYWWRSEEERDSILSSDDSNEIRRHLYLNLDANQ